MFDANLLLPLLLSTDVSGHWLVWVDEICAPAIYEICCAQAILSPASDAGSGDGTTGSGSQKRLRLIALLVKTSRLADKISFIIKLIIKTTLF